MFSEHTHEPLGECVHSFSFIRTIFKRRRHFMTSSVNAVKRKSDGIYGIFGVTVLRLLPELNRRAMGTRCIVCILFEIRHLVFWQRKIFFCSLYHHRSANLTSFVAVKLRFRVCSECCTLSVIE